MQLVGDIQGNTPAPRAAYFNIIVLVHTYMHMQQGHTVQVSYYSKYR